MVHRTRSEVIGTSRNPEGDPRGKIDGVVIRSAEGGTEVRMGEALEMALNMLLWCDRGGKTVEIEAVDYDRDGRVDYLRTTPDHSLDNNLLRLPIWDRTRRVWLDYQGHPLTSAA